ncbi:hypothetical protein GUJ93_ZPchr0002g26163 [Zizania palustris]|uniref:Uncharacterized protein n=1 Tax=Zizania palustris TaxID=103762 RepID=A0A8J5SF70_ZIZPA|nr:hypothetical protein GUJ93_ZPchr0002g26163 [Zizania palustris]
MTGGGGSGEEMTGGGGSGEEMTGGGGSGGGSAWSTDGIARSWLERREKWQRSEKWQWGKVETFAGAGQSPT